MLVGDCYLCMLYFLCVVYVSFSYHLPFILRLVLVRFSIGSRLVLDRSSIDSRSSFVHPPFDLRSAIEERTKNERRTIEE